jgi:SAM-dependent methyltransferase
MPFAITKREEIGSRLRAGRLVADADFDVHLGHSLRHLSDRHWTPVGVAARVARWLADCDGISRVLDVGSGAGKFCVVGALCGELRFTGVEQRDELVAAARLLASRFGVDRRTEFVHGALEAIDFHAYDALYFFNPFGENLLPWMDRVDHSVELSHGRFQRDVEQVERLIDGMPLGSHMVTYNGYGGRVPDSFDLVTAKMAGSNLLRLWRKASQSGSGGYWSELGDDTPLQVAGKRPQLRLRRLKSR